MASETQANYVSFSSGHKVDLPPLLGDYLCRRRTLEIDIMIINLSVQCEESLASFPKLVTESKVK